MSTNDNFNARLYARTFTARVPGVSPVSTTRDCPQPVDPCGRPCADCGSLRCLCRPRFFAGQLLTEQDLNRLDNYIREKNRLHTLQLFGAGVVNGLEVRCDSCDSGSVVVGRGYAIGPCGDDIIVCEDTLVDLCALIKKCQPADTTCKPYAFGTADNGCGDLVEDWVLTIRYAETPGRGITALRMGPTCTCGASGGSSGRSCTCGATSYATPVTRPRGAPPECEPTVICEGFSFDVFKAPTPAANRSTDQERRRIGGDLMERVLCCIQPLIDGVPRMQKTDDLSQNPDQVLYLWCCRTKAWLIGYLTARPGTFCSLLGQLQGLQCPDPTRDPNGFREGIQAATQLIARAFVEIILDCICLALLPPAPSGSLDDRLPLAIVKVRRSDCTVMEICNWTPLRRQVLTFPALEYWLSWLPIGPALRDLLHGLCCRPAGATYTRSTNAVAVDAPNTNAVAVDAASMRLNPMLSTEHRVHNQTFAMLMNLMSNRGETPLDPQVVASSFLNMNLGDTSKLTLAPEEQANAVPFLALNSILRPLLQSMQPPDATPPEVKSARVGVASPAVESVSPAELKALVERVAVLEKKVAASPREGKR